MLFYVIDILNKINVSDNVSFIISSVDGIVKIKKKD